MAARLTTIVYPVTDLARAKSLYGQLLASAPYMDEPYYVGYRAGEHEIGLDPHGHHKGMTGPVVYWQVDDIAATLAALVAAGAETQQPISDVGGGKLVATVKDADGNVTGLIQMS
jgi:predicted enzyme related to lactoylglutathione lyase